MTQLDLALGYAARGWKVLPIHSMHRGRCTCGRDDKCPAPGKHPRGVMNGVKDASSDAQTVTAWFTQYPDANIGLATGRVSGLFVVDIDQRNNGFTNLEHWEEERGESLPATLIALTGGGGRHLMFEYPPDGPVPGRNPWMPGVDVKSDGGYVVLPQSNHVSGGSYQWLQPDAPILVAPRDLLSSIRAGTDGAGKAPLPGTSQLLSGIPEGSRDEYIFRYACRARRQHSGDDDGGRAAVTALVLDMARRADPPFPEGEALIKVQQAFKQDHDDGDDGIWDWAFLDDDERPVHHMTDLGNALRFVDRFKGRFLFVPEWGWVEWRENGWHRISEYALTTAAREVPDAIREEAQRFKDNPGQRQRLLKWGMQSESAGRLTAIERLARSDRNVIRPVTAFDADDHLLACRNGIVDLRTGEVRAYDATSDYVTKNTNVLYDPTANSEVWDRFLAETVQGDVEVMDYLQQLAGYTLTGSTDQELFVILSGPPASGKSTFLDGLHAAMGTYGTTTQADTFMYKRGQKAPTEEIARLAGMRMVSVSEIRRGESFNESLVKQFTGGDSVTARFLYHDTFEFRPQMTLWIGTNYDPDTNDQAMWRRLKKIEFARALDATQRDPRIKAIIKDPEVGGRAVLAWAVRGAIEYYKRGTLAQPTAVTLAVHSYHAEQDRFGQFLEEAMDVAPAMGVLVRDAYQGYVTWCNAAQERPMRTTSFLSELRRRGHDVVRVELSNTRMITGLSMKPMQLTQYGVGWGS